MRNFITAALRRTQNLAPEEKVIIYEELLKNISEDDDMMIKVLDALPTGVAVSDMDHKTVFLNRYLANLVRLKKGEFSDVLVWDIFVNKDISDFIRTTISDGIKRTSRIFDYSIEKKNFYLEVTVSELQHSSGKKGHLINIANVTEREKEKSEKKREESFASLTALTAGVAHELKNPLGSMSIYLQLMERQLQKPEAFENLDVCRESLISKIKVLKSEVERLNDIVVDFLSTVRPRNANLQEDLNQIIKDAVEIMIPDLEQHNITLKLELEENLPYLMLDRGFMRQVLTNLISNARDAMKELGSGTLTISTGKNSDSVILSVADTGTGIKAENLTRIFDPYFTTKKSGTGIGLTLVYKIIRGMGGDIGVDSRQGSGTTFRITLPRIEKEIKQIEWETK